MTEDLQKARSQVNQLYHSREEWKARALAAEEENDELRERIRLITGPLRDHREANY